MKVLITGAASGIAYEVALKLVERGHFVYLTTHTSEQCEEVKKKIETQNLKMLCFKLDITKEEDRNLICNLDFDVLINHAGIGIGGSIIEMPIDAVRENFEVNVFSSYRLLQLAYRTMVTHEKTGKIIIMSSLLSILPFPFLGSYASSKAAISMLASTLRLELKMIKSPIKISLIEPGAYKTGFNQVMIHNKEEWMEKNSYFYPIKDKITKKQERLFRLLEKKNYHSIVKKIVKAVEQNHPKFKIRAPFLQRLGAKLYLIFFK